MFNLREREAYKDDSKIINLRKEMLELLSFTADFGELGVYFRHWDLDV